MHSTRILTGLGLAALAILSIFLFPVAVFAAICAVLVSLGALEWTKFMGFEGWVERLFYVFAAWLCMWITKQHLLISMYVAMAWWVIAFVMLVIPISQLKWLKNRWILLPLGLLILSTTWTAAISLREVSPLTLFYAIMLVCFGDTGAYFVGCKWGKHKLAPNLSPKKTWEGLAGGMVVGMIAGMSMVFLMPGESPHYVLWMGLSIILLLIAALGDLFESLLKRLVDIKDSGSLLPGHGGVLDRIDSLAAALPIYLVLALSLHLF